MRLSYFKMLMALLALSTLLITYFYVKIYIDSAVASRVHDIVNAECIKYGQSDYTFERSVYEAAVSRMMSIPGNDRLLLRNGKIVDMKICDRGGYYEVKIFSIGFNIDPSPVVLIEKDTNMVIYNYLEQ